MAESETLINKYRPEIFEDVIGQDTVVVSMRGVIKRRDANTFLLCGPSGCGKTTLARIAAMELGVSRENIMEIDAASRTGVDDMREVMEVTRFKPFGKASGRAIILDEAHMLSRNAWNSLLKALEEPMEGVYWFICTTEPTKVPPTIKTRAASYVLKPVQDRYLGELIDDVAKAEKIKLDPSVRDLIVREAGGSPRQALSNLTVCRDVNDRKKAAELLRTALESNPQIELCKYLLDGRGSWMKVAGILEKLKDENPEGVRIVICNYMAKALMGAKSDKSATHILGILDAFAVPYNSSEGFAPLYLSVGRVLYSD